jgi:hypothetical protein
VNRIGIAQRRARLGVRHRLAPTALGSNPEQAARAVLALHATDPATVFLSVRARTEGVPPGEVERALYERRTLVRMLGMRRTMFVVPDEHARVVQAACTEAVAAMIRRRYEGLLAEAGAGDGSWLKEIEDSTEQALLTRGQASAAQLAEDEPRLRTRVRLAEGKSYAADQAITNWVLSLLAADGRIVRGRPRGSWTSSQYAWSPVRQWLPEGLTGMPVARARAELVRLWLARFGPATVADLRWWTGWGAGQLRPALTEVGPVEVDLGGVTGLVLADDLAPVDQPPPWVALLPALDPTGMGWSERSWYLGEHREALFDRSGNIGPTVWCDGRIVGGWAQRADGDVALRLLQDVGRETAAAVEAAAGRLAEWVGPVRVKPRFRTPLERELTA